MPTDVQNFYAAKTIFITGTTGFVGQILLSKLLCSCPELRCIYVLIREKHGKSIHERLKEILDDPVFDCVKELHSDYATKIRPIRGNIEENDLGITDLDREIIENEVEIIFHGAATVKFNASLRKAISTNVKSLDIMLNILKKATRLKAFVYISTAFAPSAGTTFIQEKFYDPPLSLHNLLRLVEQMNDEALDKMTPRLINPFPNTYIYSKLIAEDLCRDKGSNLPMCIFRPSIKPVTGWVKNFHGATGIVFCHSLGILKFAPVNGSKIGSIVPGDYAINALILAAYFTSTLWESRSKKVKFDIPVINYSGCATKFKRTWGELLSEYNKVLEKYPFYNMVTLPGVKFVGNSKLYSFLITIFHLFPAFVFDLALTVMGKKSRFNKFFRKIHESLDLTSFFSNQEWTISVCNIYKIWTQLSEKDREIFYCDLNDLNVGQYIEALIHGVRLYVAKDSETTIEKAKQKRKRLLLLYYVLSTFVALIFMGMLVKCFNCISFAYFGLVHNPELHPDKIISSNF